MFCAIPSGMQGLNNFKDWVPVNSVSVIIQDMIHDFIANTGRDASCIYVGQETWVDLKNEIENKYRCRQDITVKAVKEFEGLPVFIVQERWHLNVA